MPDNETRRLSSRRQYDAFRKSSSKISSPKESSSTKPSARALYRESGSEEDVIMRLLQRGAMTPRRTPDSNKLQSTTKRKQDSIKKIILKKKTEIYSKDDTYVDRFSQDSQFAFVTENHFKFITEEHFNGTTHDSDYLPYPASEKSKTCVIHDGSCGAYSVALAFCLHLIDEKFDTNESEKLYKLLRTWNGTYPNETMETTEDLVEYLKKYVNDHAKEEIQKKLGPVVRMYMSIAAEYHNIAVNEALKSRQPSADKGVTENTQTAANNVTNEKTSPMAKDATEAATKVLHQSMASEEPAVSAVETQPQPSADQYYVNNIKKHYTQIFDLALSATSLQKQRMDKNIEENMLVQAWNYVYPNEKMENPQALHAHLRKMSTHMDKDEFSGKMANVRTRYTSICSIDAGQISSIEQLHCGMYVESQSPEWDVSILDSIDMQKMRKNVADAAREEQDTTNKLSMYKWLEADELETISRELFQVNLKIYHELTIPQPTYRDYCKQNQHKEYVIEKFEHGLVDKKQPYLESYRHQSIDDKYAYILQHQKHEQGESLQSQRLTPKEKADIEVIEEVVTTHYSVQEAALEVKARQIYEERKIKEWKSNPSPTGKVEKIAKNRIRENVINILSQKTIASGPTYLKRPEVARFFEKKKKGIDISIVNSNGTHWDLLIDRNQKEAINQIEKRSLKNTWSNYCACPYRALHELHLEDDPWDIWINRLWASLLEYLEIIFNDWYLAYFAIISLTFILTTSITAVTFVSIMYGMWAIAQMIPSVANTIHEITCEILMRLGIETEEYEHMTISHDPVSAVEAKCINSNGDLEPEVETSSTISTTNTEQALYSKAPQIPEPINLESMFTKVATPDVTSSESSCSSEESIDLSSRSNPVSEKGKHSTDSETSESEKSETQTKFDIHERKESDALGIDKNMVPMICCR